jgi:large subunit ribosomal protein L21
MFAVIQTGGKQYRVAKNDVVTVEKLAAEVGSNVTFDDVRLVGGEGAPTVGSPSVAGAQVSAEVVDQGKGRTIKVFKKKRRKNYRRCNGHRQRHTVLRVTDISVEGKSAGDTDEKKAKQASQKAGSKSQKQATQSAATQKSQAKATTAKGRSTQAGGTKQAGGTTQAKNAGGQKSSGQKSSGQKTAGQKAASQKSGGQKAQDKSQGNPASGGSEQSEE